MSVSGRQVDSEVLTQIFNQLDLGSLHKSKAAWEDFFNRDTLPVCGICTKTPEKCTHDDSQGSHRCANCIRRKEACSWKSDIAVIEILRRYPQVDPAQAKARYNHWVENSRRKRPMHGEEMLSNSETVDEIPTKRKRRVILFKMYSSHRNDVRPRAPYRTWATEEIPGITAPALEVAAPQEESVPVRIMTLEDLNAFNYAILKKEKEAAEDARNEMALSLDVALRKINVLEEDNRKLRVELAAWKNKS